MEGISVHGNVKATGLISLLPFWHFPESPSPWVPGSASLRCCARAFSSCGEQELFFVAVCGLLIAVASLVAEHGL